MGGGGGCGAGGDSVGESEQFGGMRIEGDAEKCVDILCLLQLSNVLKRRNWELASTIYVAGALQDGKIHIHLFSSS